MILYLIFILFAIVSSVIFIDSGSYQQLVATSGFNCKNNYQTTKTISFSDTFQTIPQVFIYQYYFDIPWEITEYQFSITSITLIDFQFFVKCPQPGKVYGIKYQWIAIDDQRVQVINAFNMNPPQDKVFNHQLLNADTAIIGLTSLGYSGQLDFRLSVTSITADSVTVGISKVTGKFSNLQQIGYQILLVSSRDIVDLGLVTFIPLYNSNTINLKPNNWLLLPFQGIKFSYGCQLTLDLIKTIGTSTMTYQYKKWQGLYDQSEYTIQNIWLSQQLKTNFALECLTLRISQKLDITSSNRPSFFVQILQTNQMYFNVGQFSIKTYKPIKNINFIFEIKCIKGKRIISQFNKCNNCSYKKFYKFNHFCHSQINLVSYFPKFTQIDSVNQEFTIIITENSLSVMQVLYNQAKSEQNIIKIEYQDA